MRIGILFLPLALAACVEQPVAPPPNNWNEIDAGLQRFRGHEVRELAAVLGYPNSQRESLGDVLYIWTIDQNLPWSSPNMVISNGNVGGTPFYGVTSQMQTTVIHVHCTIEVATAAQGLIRNWRFDGQNGACWQYAQALR